MRTLRFVLSLCLLCGTSLAAQSITILLLDGRTGKPIPKSRANLWIGKHVSAIPTSFDENGGANLLLNRQDPEDERIFATSNTLRMQLGYQPCWKRKMNTPQLVIFPFSKETILKDGIVTQNTCGYAVSALKPGQLVLYVKPLSFWQRMRE